MFAEAREVPVVTDVGAKPEGQTQEAPDATAQLLASPAVVEALSAREREVEARVEAHWKKELDRHTRELGAKQGTWGLKEKDYQTKLDEAEARLEAAKLSDDQESIARSRIQLVRLQREAQAKDQEFITRDRDLALREVMLGIREQYPGLPAKFWEDAARKLGEGTPSYVIEREARGQTPGNAPKPKTEGAPPPFEIQGGGGERVTKDNVDKLHIEGKYPDDKYREFLRSGTL